MKTGMILVCSFGYDCTLVNFYKVIRVTNSNVWLQQLENQWESSDGYDQVGKVIPSNRETKNKPFMRRIQHQYSDNREYVMISKYQYASIWDGKPVYYNSMN